ncbi:MAG: hypothetical protein ACOX68_00570 [Candidatus Limivicinus sp.]|jgi:gas vesicle protein
MNKKNFLIGMGLGLVVGGCTACAVKHKKHSMKNALGKTFKNLSDVADSVSNMLGW